ncbi:MAG: acyl-CoA dehydrogenase family protein [Acidimicrobiia bacterium]|nr:acyl-CoA dehydrogenase family protein [Acidimicrobiia bacterium]
MISIEELTAEAETFLGAHAEPRRAREFRWGEGEQAMGLFPERPPAEEAAEVAAAKAWRREVFDAGFGWLAGPEAYGGRGLSLEHERAWQAVEARYETPSVVPFGITYGMIAPTILAHGTEKAKQLWLEALYRGDLIACQLFSEPGAGSDLAGVSTRAERDGDEWILSGQKVWTSGAHYSGIGEILTRTSTDKPKHKGLTMFVVEMDAPGVEVRPLRQMTGGSAFNEVYLDGARVADWQRLGEVDDGWRVALTTLMNERAAIGSAVGAGMTDEIMTRLLALVQQLGVGSDADVRLHVAEIFSSARIARYTTERATAKMEAGQLPGPEMSIGKLQLTQNLERIGDLLGHMLGPRLVADTGEWGTYAWGELVLSTPGMRVAGGTDEVMRNIIGERVLGLPKEPRVDAQVPSGGGT